MRTYCGCDNGPIGSDEKIELQFDDKIVPVISGGSNDYNNLNNKPSINGVQLVGNKTNEELLIKAISNSEIEDLLRNFV